MLVRRPLFERFTTLPPQAAAPLLLAIAHAGAGAAPFASWRGALPAHVEFAAARFPGRESYIREPPLEKLSDIVELLARGVGDWAPAELVIFGQCSGAIIALELARELRRRAEIRVSRLFIASQGAPNRQRRSIEALSDRELYDLLKEEGAIPEKVAYGEAMWKLAAPTLRADFLAIEQFEPDRTPLDVPFTILVGSEDARITAKDVQDWSLYTTNEVTIRSVPGGHLLMPDHATNVLAIVADTWPIGIGSLPG